MDCNYPKYGDLLNLVSPEVRTLYRKYESVNKRIIKAKWSATFNRICIKEDIMPVYTRIRHHDPALNNSHGTRQYQISLMNREIVKAENLIVKLNKECEQVYRQMGSCNACEESKALIQKSLDCILDNSNKIHKTSILKKLNKFYNGQIVLKEEINCYVNLSDYELSQHEKDFLNLGLNYHIQPRYSKLHKQTELEVLYSSLLDLEKQNKVTINPRINELLAAECTKHRNPYYRSTISPELKNAAKNLKTNENIVIRKADKSSMYVILNKKDYLDKLDEILSDTTKFCKITKNPTEALKKKANNIISSLDVVKSGVNLPKIIGDYSPGYVYGNVKIHKTNNPLRPIISQIPSPTYQLAKSLNKMISPYIPSKYAIKSTDEFLDILHSTTCSGVIASLDV